MPKECRFHRPKLIDLSEVMHELLEVSGIVFRSYIGRFVVSPLSRDRDLWEIVSCDPQIDIAIVSLEETIVFRIVLLDEIIFEKKCL